ncbi:hypothetical protein I4U23_004483 [Adineta vaga]|nr:hypothetical protein I4U23_004483 [Adineta vaga]
MHNVLFHRNNFSGSNISEMHYISNGYLPGTIDFTDTDLINCYATFDDDRIDLTGHLIDNNITILNARLPNGSFYKIDSSNLIIHGRAQQHCQSNKSENIWISSESLPLMEISPQYKLIYQ